MQGLTKSSTDAHAHTHTNSWLFLLLALCNWALRLHQWQSQGDLSLSRSLSFSCPSFFSLVFKLLHISNFHMMDVFATMLIFHSSRLYRHNVCYISVLKIRSQRIPKKDKNRFCYSMLKFSICKITSNEDVLVEYV